MSRSVDLVGSEVAGFRIIKLLGTARTCNVYLGANTLNRNIVRSLAIVSPALARRPEFVEAFVRDAHRLERLAHPNIVRFHGLRRDGEFLLMELEPIEGESLQDRLRRTRGRPVPIEEVLRIGAGAARGLAAAHEQGMLHRDVKAASVLVSADGTVRILDLGLASAADEADRQTRSIDASCLPGEPAYQAPEIFSGHPPTASSDVYSLGIVLSELLLGRHPLVPPGGPPASVVGWALLHQGAERAALGAVRPDTPASVEAILAASSAPTVAQRLSTARDLASRLDAVIAELADDEPPTLGLPVLASGPVPAPAMALRRPPGQNGAVAGAARPQPSGASPRARSAAAPKALPLPPASTPEPDIDGTEFSLPPLRESTVAQPWDPNETPPPRARGSVVAAAAISAVVLLGAGVAWLLWSGPDPDPAAAPAETPARPAAASLPGPPALRVAAPASASGGPATAGLERGAPGLTIRATFPAGRRKTNAGAREPRKPLAAPPGVDPKQPGQGCDAKGIQRTATASMAEMRACYDALLTRRPGAAGRVTLRWTVTRSGLVTGEKVVDSSLDDVTVTQCVLKVLRRTRFDRPAAECEIDWPLQFSP